MGIFGVRLKRKSRLNRTMKKQLVVCAMTGGENVPSARYRIRQYKKHLIEYGVDIKEYKAPYGMYPPKNRLLRGPWGVVSICSRLPGLIASRFSDVTVFQRELISTYTTLEILSRKPRVFDVDDAIWLHGNGKFADRLASICDCVICGNDYIADYFKQWNRNIKILPTGVDTDRFCPLVSTSTDQFFIGWSGTSSGFKYLRNIQDALAIVIKKYKNVYLRIVADQEPKLESIPKEKIIFIKWDAACEVSSIQGMGIGIMPLADTGWERGKCSYKMLLYMACGIPVVVSPVGMNNEVLKHGQCGFYARGTKEWVDAIVCLIEDRLAREEAGKVGRKVVEKHYASKLIACKLSGYIRELVP